jgi:hypothetical protein
MSSFEDFVEFVRIGNIEEVRRVIEVDSSLPSRKDWVIIYLHIPVFLRNKID